MTDPRTLPDPHERYHEWRVLHGYRQYRYNEPRVWVGQWYNEWIVGAYLFGPTPERITLWAELVLQPFEP